MKQLTVTLPDGGTETRKTQHGYTAVLAARVEFTSRQVRVVPERGQMLPALAEGERAVEIEATRSSAQTFEGVYYPAESHYVIVAPCAPYWKAVSWHRSPALAHKALDTYAKQAWHRTTTELRVVTTVATREIVKRAPRPVASATRCRCATYGTLCPACA